MCIYGGRRGGRAERRAGELPSAPIGGWRVCVCSERKPHNGHTEGLWQRLHSEAGRRSENGHPGALDQAGREGRLTVFAEVSLGGLRSSFPAHQGFSHQTSEVPSSPSSDVICSLEGARSEKCPGNRETVPQRRRGPDTEPMPTHLLKVLKGQFA